jgi:predicted nuclease of predicted toxin-antitoxin system
MTVRFQADADLNLVIVLAVVRREPAIDFQTSLSASLPGRKDPEVLAMAAREGRVLVTHDQRTMPQHFAEFIATRMSPGVLVLPQHMPVSLAVEELLLIWGATEAEEWTNRICYLPI